MFSANLRQQRDNFLLQGRIQLTGWFVGDQQRRSARNCLRNRDSLPLSATELMWIRIIDFFRTDESNLA